MFTLFIFAIVLGILVFVHELGHFLVARRNGVNVFEFGFGFPPRIFGFKKNNGKYKFFIGSKDVESEDTIYSVNLIPLGGFVKIKGEQGDFANEPDSFANKKAWVRFKILFAGVFMNFILGFVFLTIGFFSNAPVEIPDSESSVGVADLRVQIMQVLPNSPANKAGLEMADTIKKVDNTEIKSIKDLNDYVGKNEGKELTFVIERKKDILIKTITPEKIENNPPRIGVALVRTGIKDYAWYEAIWLGLKTTILMIYGIFIGFSMVIKNLLFSGNAGVELTGPVGIAVLTGKIAKQGFVYLIQFVAILSINLGVINLMPFPALDGGRILFLVIEKLRGKPVTKNIENYVHFFGFMLFLLLMVFITAKDILNLK